MSNIIGLTESLIDEDFKDWCDWIDSMQEPDGSINLDKHPEIIEWYKQWTMPAKERLEEIERFMNSEESKGIGETVDFELPERFMSNNMQSEHKPTKIYEFVRKSTDG